MMAARGVIWTVPPSKAFGELSDAYAAAIRQAVRTLANRYAPEIEAWMKENAPWTDRTGNARQGLSATVEDGGMDMATIILAGAVSYQIYLELANNGVWAAITPALDLFGPRIFADVRALLA